jgi:hypothetical protein
VNRDGASVLAESLSSDGFGEDICTTKPDVGLKKKFIHHWRMIMNEVNNNNIKYLLVCLKFNQKLFSRKRISITDKLVNEMRVSNHSCSSQKKGKKGRKRGILLEINDHQQKIKKD